MIDYILKFRFSNYWYLFVLIFIFIIISFLIYIKKRSAYRYQRLSNIIIFALWIPLAILSLLILIMLAISGFSKDFVSNYTGVLLIVGPIIIFFLIIYALRRDKKVEDYRRKVKGPENNQKKESNPHRNDRT